MTAGIVFGLLILFLRPKIKQFKNGEIIGDFYEPILIKMDHLFVQLMR